MRIFKKLIAIRLFMNYEKNCVLKDKMNVYKDKMNVHKDKMNVPKDKIWF